MDEFARFEAQVVVDKPWLGFGVVFVTLCRSWWLSVDSIVVVIVTCHFYLFLLPLF